MPVIIGGERAWKVRQHGDIAVSFQWVNGEESMILYPARRSLPGAGAFAIGISSAHTYANNDGTPTVQALQKVAAGAKTMGMSDDRFTLYRILDIILDTLPDLLEMPPEPNWAAAEAKRPANVGELSIKVDGETVAEREVNVDDLTEEAVH